MAAPRPDNQCLSRCLPPVIAYRRRQAAALRLSVPPGRRAGRGGGEGGERDASVRALHASLVPDGHVAQSYTLGDFARKKEGREKARPLTFRDGASWPKGPGRGRHLRDKRTLPARAGHHSGSPEEAFLRAERRAPAPQGTEKEKKKPGPTLQPDRLSRADLCPSAASPTFVLK